VSTQKLRRASDISNAVFEKIIAAKPASKLLPDRKKINFFLKHYFANVPVDDMVGKSPEIMGRAAISHLEFAKVRKPGEVRLRLYNPKEKRDGYDSRFTIVEMVNDNMPFLVDSVSSAIGHQDLAVHMTIHPVLRVTRDANGNLLEVVDRNSPAPVCGFRR
jgi:glutamate dehydrogenase